MKKINSIIFLTLLTALFALCKINAQAVHYEWRLTFDCDPTIWCLPEPASGEIVYNGIDRYDKSGNLVGWHLNLKGGKIIGCETNTVYKAINTVNSVSNVNIINNQEVHIYNEKLKFIGKKGEKYVATWKGHLTINANGEVKVDKFEVDWCD